MTDKLLQISNLDIVLPEGSERDLAVKNLNIDLSPGETLCIVGESGSGKTTTAMATIRLEDAADGAVRFQGHDLLSLDDKGMRAARRDVQLIFQDPYSSLNPRARVSQIVRELYSLLSYLDV